MTEATSAITRRAGLVLPLVGLWLGCNAIIGLEAPTRGGGSGGHASTSTGHGAGTTTGSGGSAGAGGTTTSGSSSSSSSTSSSSTSSSSASSSSSSSSGGAPGDACKINADCALGHCVRGMCCDTACDQSCQVCRASEKGSGPDGVCGNAAPQRNCATVCDGVNSLLGSCAADGTCNHFGGMSACDPYVCTLSLGCPNECWTDQDCSPMFACPPALSTKRVCLGPLAAGASCDTNRQCTSGTCNPTGTCQ